MQDATTTDVPARWEANHMQYEKWIDRARGTKSYRAIFINSQTRIKRLSRTEFKRASDVFIFVDRFEHRFV